MRSAEIHASFENARPSGAFSPRRINAKHRVKSAGFTASKIHPSPPPEGVKRVDDVLGGDKAFPCFLSRSYSVSVEFT